MAFLFGGHPLAIGDTIHLPGVPPVDKNGRNPEYDRQVETCLREIRDALVQLESYINTGRL